MDVKIVGMVDNQVLSVNGKKYYEDGNHTISVSPNKHFNVVCMSINEPLEYYTMEIDGTADFVVDASYTEYGPTYSVTPESSGRIQITMM